VVSLSDVVQERVLRVDITHLALKGLTRLIKNIRNLVRDDRTILLLNKKKAFCGNLIGR